MAGKFGSQLADLGRDVYFVFTCRSAVRSRVEFALQPRRWAFAALFLAAYVIIPFFWMNRALAANNHYVGTLIPERMAERRGKTIQLDRVTYESRQDGEGELIVFAGERLRTSGMNLAGDAKVSLQGRFSHEHGVVVDQRHVHHSWHKEMASSVGLFLIVFVWIGSIARKRLEADAQ